MTETFDLSLYRLEEDAILLLDNINTAERLEKEAHRLRPDSVTIYFQDVDIKCTHAVKVRVRVIEDVSVIQWKDPFHRESEDWESAPLDAIKHIQGHWFKKESEK